MTKHRLRTLESSVHNGANLNLHLNRCLNIIAALINILVWFFMGFTEGIKVLAGKVLGSILNKLKLCLDISFLHLLSLMTHWSIQFYGCFKDAPAFNAVQNRVMRCFLLSGLWKGTWDGSRFV